MVSHNDVIWRFWQRFWQQNTLLLLNPGSGFPVHCGGETEMAYSRAQQCPRANPAYVHSLLHVTVCSALSLHRLELKISLRGRPTLETI